VPPSPSASPGIDPCGLATQAELETIIGRSLVRTVSVARSGRPIECRWEFEAGRPGFTWELDLGVTFPGGRKAFDDARPFAADGTPIPSLGDGAYPVVGNTIFAVKGDALVSVQYVDGGADPNRVTVPERVLRLVLQQIP
jgi:hypothetical protein